jgi:hypothetical protein
LYQLAAVSPLAPLLWLVYAKVIALETNPRYQVALAGNINLGISE